MEIKAKCKFDYDTIKDLTRASLFYKKGNPKRRFVAALIMCFFILIFSVINLINKLDYVFVMYFVLGVLLLLLDIYLYFLLPKVRYKALANMRETNNEYTFCDDVIRIVTTNNDYNGAAEINYSLLVKVCETSKYFFLYQTKNQVLIVDKSTIENGTADDLKNKLISYVRDKYTVFNF